MVIILLLLSSFSNVGKSLQGQSQETLRSCAYSALSESIVSICCKSFVQSGHVARAISSLMAFDPGDMAL